MSKFGRMDLGTMGSGEKAWLMAEDGWYMPTEMCTLVSGERTRLTGMEFNKIIMEVATKAIGLMINNMEMELKHGQMAQHISVNTLTA